MPHIFAPDEVTLFEAYGYTVAEDRLWQLEINRRAARGELAAVLGERFVEADRLVRMTGYSDDELRQQFEALPVENQRHIDAYIAGINRYMLEVSARPEMLPYEFYRLQLAPVPWTTGDAIAFGVFMLRRFGEIGGREAANEAFLADLIARFGDEVAADIFNDVLWDNDPAAPTTIPLFEVATATATASATLAPGSLPAALHEPRAISRVQWPRATATATALATTTLEGFPDLELALRLWAEASAPSRLGSYAWVVDANKSAAGQAMLYGGPQMGHAVPEVVHEVQLHTDDGLNVTGMAFVGVPYVLIGHNADLAWTSTTAVGDNVDLYRETLCRTDDGGWGSRFQGACQPARMRREVIAVRGGVAVGVDIWRTLHGPASMSWSHGSAVAQKRAHAGKEYASLVGFYGFNRARGLAEFAAATKLVVTQHNFLYADVAGNIAYWQAGHIPVRPRGFDFRLPLPGDGNAEWPGGMLPMPQSINPEQGYLANWNNKPCASFDSADSQYFGKQSRLSDIVDRLQTGKIGWDDMRDIPIDIGRVDMSGRHTRFLKPYLLQALQKHPSDDPLVQAAAHVMRGYDGTVFDDAIGSIDNSVGHAIFSAWEERIRARVFAPTLGKHAHLARIDLLVRALDFAIRGHASLAMKHRFIEPKLAYPWMAEAFAEAVDVLRIRHGDAMQNWQVPRAQTSLTHPVLGRIDSLPASNRATYAQVVRLGSDGVYGESIFTLGQSGHVGVGSAHEPVLHHHFKDLLPKYRAFEYKPMVFLDAAP